MAWIERIQWIWHFDIGEEQRGGRILDWIGWLVLLWFLGLRVGKLILCENGFVFLVIAFADGEF